MVTFLYEEAKRESGVLWFSTRVVKATKVPSGILRKLSVKVCTKGSPMEMTFLENLSFVISALPDLVLNIDVLRGYMEMTSIPMRYLQCAYEENCLSASAERQLR